jgi:hypothetical protein
MERVREAKRVLRTFRSGNEGPLSPTDAAAAARKSYWFRWYFKAEENPNPSGPKLEHSSTKPVVEVTTTWWGWLFQAAPSVKVVQSPEPAKIVTGRVGWAPGAAAVVVSAVGLWWLFGLGLLMSREAPKSLQSPAPAQAGVAS